MSHTAEPPLTTQPAGAALTTQELRLPTGVIYSYTFIDRPTPEGGFYPPAVLVLVQLHQGPIVTGLLLDVPVRDVKIGLEVQMLFNERDPEDPGRGENLFFAPVNPPARANTSAQTQAAKPVIAKSKNRRRRVLAGNKA